MPTSSAFPNWTAFYGPSNNPTQIATSTVAYDSTSLGGALVILVDSNAPAGGAPLPIQGQFSGVLEGSSLAAATTASLGQAGTVPVNAQSLVFWSVIGGSLQVSFNGQPLNYLMTGSTANYNIYGADVSAFAGQTGQLLFTAPVQNSALLDNIQFSSSPIPEPKVCALIGLAAAFLWRGLVRSKR